MGNRRASQPPEDRLVLPRGHDVDVRTVIVPPASIRAITLS